MLETFGYLGYALWVSLSGKGKTYEGKEIKRRGFQGEVRISWGGPQNTRRCQGGRSILQNTALQQHRTSKYIVRPSLSEVPS